MLKKDWIRFDRNELSGSFGDLGTSFPLIIGLVLTCKLDVTSVMVMFGVMQIFTGFMYGMPMSVQPLKAMAVIMISQKLNGDLLYGAGLAIGITMLLLSVTNILDYLVRIIPLSVIRGIQFGLGLSLANLALNDYVQADGYIGYILAFIAFAITLVLLGNRKYPSALIVMSIALIYALIFELDFHKLNDGIGFQLPNFHVPTKDMIWQGFLALALPQIALSISNSVVATHQTTSDLFPEKKLTYKKIGITYSVMNIVNAFFSGIPTCHGSGGIAGHYTFGARTGGSVIIYGSICIVIGLFFSSVFDEVIKCFPFPILGIILLFESITLMSFIKSIIHSKKDLVIALLVALMALGLPHGYVIGLIVGSLIYYLSKNKMIMRFFGE